MRHPWCWRRPADRNRPTELHGRVCSTNRKRADRIGGNGCGEDSGDRDRSRSSSSSTRRNLRKKFLSSCEHLRLLSGFRRASRFDFVLRVVSGEPRHAFQTRPFAPVVDPVLSGLLAFGAPESRRYGAAGEVFSHRSRFSVVVTGASPCARNKQEVPVELSWHRPPAPTQKNHATSFP